MSAPVGAVPITVGLPGNALGRSGYLRKAWMPRNSVIRSRCGLVVLEERAELHDVELLGAQHGVAALELGAVVAAHDAGVHPVGAHVGPLGDPVLEAVGREAGEELRPVRRGLRPAVDVHDPLREEPLDGVAEDRDHLHVGVVGADPLQRLRPPQVERRRVTHELLAARLAGTVKSEKSPLAQSRRLVVEVVHLLLRGARWISRCLSSITDRVLVPDFWVPPMQKLKCLSPEAVLRLDRPSTRFLPSPACARVNWLERRPPPEPRRLTQRAESPSSHPGPFRGKIRGPTVCSLH